MGRDITVISTNTASESVTIRSIISAESRVDVTAATVRFHLKPNKVFLFEKDTGVRIRWDMGEAL
jgi:multiple sugar transport system ATP-binding protein